MHIAVFCKDLQAFALKRGKMWQNLTLQSVGSEPVFILSFDEGTTVSFMPHLPQQATKNVKFLNYLLQIRYCY
jgi:hypothetical protein